MNLVRFSLRSCGWNASSFVVLLFWLSTRFAQGTLDETRPVSFWNKASSNAMLYWINENNDFVFLSDIASGKWFHSRSFPDHRFEIWEKPSVPGDDNTCYDAPNNQCRFCPFQVIDDDQHQGVTIMNDFDCFQFSKQDSHGLTEAQSSWIVEVCRKKLEANVTQTDAETHIDDFMSCVQNEAGDVLAKLLPERLSERGWLGYLGNRNEEYVCEDDTLESSPPKYSETWEHSETLNNVTSTNQYDVDIHLQLSTSKIHVISNFVTQHECDVMVEKGQDGMTRASVYDSNGGSTYSDHRKALQNFVEFFMSDADKTVPNIADRIYAYTNHILGMDLNIVGQEYLNLIQYEGRGRNYTGEPADRYKPHCDGTCDGKKIKSGSRLATMIIYCKTAEEGGHTHFQKANVHLKPKALDAVFFSYVDPDSLITDPEYTRHSGCPVYEGTKQIVTHWMRYGVSRERPYFNFEPSGDYNPNKGEEESCDEYEDSYADIPEFMFEDVSSHLSSSSSSSGAVAAELQLETGLNAGYGGSTARSDEL